MHLGITLLALVLGGAGRRNERGVDCRAGPEQQTALLQQAIDSGQDLICQLVMLQPVAETQDGALFG